MSCHQSFVVENGIFNCFVCHFLFPIICLVSLSLLSFSLFSSQCLPSSLSVVLVFTNVWSVTLDKTQANITPSRIVLKVKCHNSIKVVFFRRGPEICRRKQCNKHLQILHKLFFLKSNYLTYNSGYWCQFLSKHQTS